MKSGVLRFSVVVVLAMMASSCGWKIYDYKSDVYNQEGIVDGYYKYVDQEKKRPSSLGEIVAKGCLPERSPLYSRETGVLFVQDVKYDRGDYKIVPKRKGSNDLLSVKYAEGKWDFDAVTSSYVGRHERRRPGIPNHRRVLPDE
jgi:hypothetical protein